MTGNKPCRKGDEGARQVTVMLADDC